MARIRKGDLVAVLSGKNRGKTGKVLRVWPEAGRAFVERVNLVKHFDRRGQQNQPGGIVEREGSLALAKLAVMCPRCKKGARVRWLASPDGTKQRICHRCQEVLS